MGEVQNTTARGEAKMAVLESLDRVSEAMTKKKYTDLTAAEKLVVDQEYDAVAKTIMNTPGQHDAPAI